MGMGDVGDVGGFGREDPFVRSTSVSRLCCCIPFTVVDASSCHGADAPASNLSRAGDASATSLAAGTAGRNSNSRKPRGWSTFSSTSSTMTLRMYVSCASVAIPCPWGVTWLDLSVPCGGTAIPCPWRVTWLDLSVGMSRASFRG